MSTAVRDTAPGGDAPEVVRAWDPAVRMFHWTLVVLIVSAYVTRNYSSDPTLYLHRLNGYAVLTLLLFRVLWGVWGSSTARLSGLVPLPGPVARYGVALLRGGRLHYLGHNPLGSVLILLMLLALVAQASTGLFTTDDTIAHGPLYSHVSEAAAARASSYHAKGFWIILALGAIHVVANLIYQFAFKDRLITAMVTGVKPKADYIDAKQARLASPWAALLCLIVSLAVVGGSVVLAGGSLLR